MVLRDVFIGIWLPLLIYSIPLNNVFLVLDVLGHPGAYRYLQPEVHGEVLEVIGVP